MDRLELSVSYCGLNEGGLPVVVDVFEPVVQEVFDVLLRWRGEGSRAQVVAAFPDLILLATGFLDKPTDRRFDVVGERIKVEDSVVAGNERVQPVRTCWPPTHFRPATGTNAVANSEVVLASVQVHKPSGFLGTTMFGPHLGWQFGIVDLREELAAQ